MKNNGRLSYWEFYKGFKQKGFKFDQVGKGCGAPTFFPWLLTLHEALLVASWSGCRHTRI